MLVQLVEMVWLALKLEHLTIQVPKSGFKNRIQRLLIYGHLAVFCIK
jgi:hypothetical protein